MLFVIGLPPKFAKLSKILWKICKFWKRISVHRIHSGGEGHVSNKDLFISREHFDNTFSSCMHVCRTHVSRERAKGSTVSEHTFSFARMFVEAEFKIFRYLYDCLQKNVDSIAHFLWSSTIRFWVIHIQARTSYHGHNAMIC
jgi:hypothetical protein